MNGNGGIPRAILRLVLCLRTGRLQNRAPIFRDSRAARSGSLRPMRQGLSHRTNPRSSEHRTGIAVPVRSGFRQAWRSGRGRYGYLFQGRNAPVRERCRCVGVFQQGNQVMLTAEHSTVCAALIQYVLIGVGVGGRI